MKKTAPDAPRSKRREKVEGSNTHEAAQTPTSGGRTSGQDHRPPGALARGETIAGRYRVVKKIGYGGMGVVYLAEDLNLKRRVAIKTRKFDPFEDRQSLGEISKQRFNREAQVTAGINHPNVVSVFDAGEHGDAAYYVMEYHERSESLSALRERLEQEGRPFEELELLECAIQMTSALAAVHATSGVWHRDVKPDNFIVFQHAAGAPIAKLLDFGVVSLPGSDITGFGVAIGTVPFIAPEVLGLFLEQGLLGDQCSDLFALGVSLYWLLLGTYPYGEFSSTAAAEDYFRHASTQPALPTTVRPDIDPEWDGILLKLLEPHPEDRYRSALELGEELAALRSRLVQRAPTEE
ncbi:MAG: serine/threonine-protein kinase [Pseudomonadota bacterium]